MRIELGDLLKVLVGLDSVPVCSRMMPRQKWAWRLSGSRSRTSSRRVERLVEVDRERLPAGLLGLLGLHAAVVEQSDRQVDRAGDPARGLLMHLAKRLGRLAVLVLLHEAEALEVGRHDRVEFARRNLVLERSAGRIRLDGLRSVAGRLRRIGWLGLRRVVSCLQAVVNNIPGHKQERGRRDRELGVASKKSFAR